MRKHKAGVKARQRARDRIMTTSIGSEWSNLYWQSESSVILSGRELTLGRHDETTTLRRTAVNSLDDVDHLWTRVRRFDCLRLCITHLLLVIHSPITRGAHRCQYEGRNWSERHSHLVVVTSTQINHDMLIPSLRVNESLSSGMENQTYR